MKFAAQVGGSLTAVDMDIHAIDFHVFVCADEDVLHTADDTGLDQVAAGGIYLDGNIGGGDLELVVDDVLGAPPRSRRPHRSRC